MVDYSPHPTHGEFFRAVVSSRTTKDTVDNLVAAIEKLGNI
jgi:glutamate decarboxylase